MRISLKDEKFFKSILGVFADRGGVTLDTRQEAISISSHGQSSFYLTMTNDVVIINGESLTFTVKAQHLLEGMSVLSGCDLIAQDELRLVDGRSTISIPFIPTVRSEYEELDAPSTKIIVGPELLDGFMALKGLVTYEVEKDKLFVRRAGGEVLEEVEFPMVDFIVAGDLQFRCNNKWTDVLGKIRGYVDSMMLAFGPDILCIQFLFKRYPGSYLELRVSRSLEE
ncbi:hypothetical protein [Encephalitozoon cuniculi GB-M1]|uniref:Uncharacterized protein n=1 Tax=Encephalitozoon cuniculi (strain GB-M1) TaxID=284813 RepID=Q8SUX4_ENCCU|nr:uncharacterized protein ECU07_1290 [Encephalitozoon cuniculi GB-M1]CAD25662.1 hypothetical protein [Encephalitozoon cuniculi GB-M1]